MTRSDLEQVASGDRRALARLLSTIVDSPSAELRDALDTHRPSHVSGFTGPPGAGKSTLVDQLIKRERQAGRRPGVVVIDPSSPLTGGALLGDRVRMQEHAGDEGVFIRSLAARGVLGGLAHGADEVIAAISLAGFEPLYLETVGVGQSEVEVVKVADTVVVVLQPGSGDEIQAAKAGILEIAHLIFVNKADQGGAERTAGLLATSLGIEVLVGSALTGDGVDELIAALAAQRKDLRRR